MQPSVTHSVSPQPTPKHHSVKPFGEHVRELRRRLLIVGLVLLAASIVGYCIHDQLFHIVRRPLHEKLYYTTPIGGFNAMIKISVLFGLLITVPITIFQTSRFLNPAFKQRIKAPRIMLLSSFLALCGVMFAYFVSLPASLNFLANVDSNDLQSIITVNEYLNFFTAYIVGFALLFQLPLIMIFINRIKPQRPRNLMKIQRWVILFSFVLAAFMTPTPDPVNQTLMALPIILLYQFSIFLVWRANRRRGITFDDEQTVDGEQPAPEPQIATNAYGETPYSAQTPALAAVGSDAETPISEPYFISDIFPVQ